MGAPVYRLAGRHAGFPPVRAVEPGRCGECWDACPRLSAGEPFDFACAGCGDCCRQRRDLVLSGFDLYRIARRLRLSPRIVAAAFCKSSGSISSVSSQENRNTLVSERSTVEGKILAALSRRLQGVCISRLNIIIPFLWEKYRSQSVRRRKYIIILTACLAWGLNCRSVAKNPWYAFFMRNAIVRAPLL